MDSPPALPIGKDVKWSAQKKAPGSEYRQDCKITECAQREHKQDLRQAAHPPLSAWRGLHRIWRRWHAAQRRQPSYIITSFSVLDYNRLVCLFSPCYFFTLDLRRHGGLCKPAASILICAA